MTPDDTHDGKDRGGWFRVTNDVFDELVAQEGPVVGVVFCYLVRCADLDGRCFPGQSDIARKCGCCERVVRDSIKTLKSKGAIAVERNEHQANRYRILKYRAPADSAGTSGKHRQIPPEAPANFAEEHRQILPPNKTHRTRHIEQGVCGKAAEPAEDRLLELIDFWNRLSASVVAAGHRARRDPPAKAVSAGWRRVHKDSEAREAFSDLHRLVSAIERAKFCHGQGWFTLPWLFGKNRNGEWNVVKLVNGGFEQNGDHPAEACVMGSAH